MHPCPEKFFSLDYSECDVCSSPSGCGFDSDFYGIGIQHMYHPLFLRSRIPALPPDLQIVREQIHRSLRMIHKTPVQVIW